MAGSGDHGTLWSARIYPHNIVPDRDDRADEPENGEGEARQHRKRKPFEAKPDQHRQRRKSDQGVAGGGARYLEAFEPNERDRYQHRYGKQGQGSFAPAPSSQSRDRSERQRPERYICPPGPLEWHWARLIPDALVQPGGHRHQQRRQWRRVTELSREQVPLESYGRTQCEGVAVGRCVVDQPWTAEHQPNRQRNRDQPQPASTICTAEVRSEEKSGRQRQRRHLHQSNSAKYGSEPDRDRHVAVRPDRAPAYSHHGHHRANRSNRDREVVVVDNSGDEHESWGESDRRRCDHRSPRVSADPSRRERSQQYGHDTEQHAWQAQCVHPPLIGTCWFVGCRQERRDRKQPLPPCQDDVIQRRLVRFITRDGLESIQVSGCERLHVQDVVWLVVGIPRWRQQRNRDCERHKCPHY